MNQFECGVERVFQRYDVIGQSSISYKFIFYIGKRIVFDFREKEVLIYVIMWNIYKYVILVKCKLYVMLY